MHVRLLALTSLSIANMISDYNERQDYSFSFRLLMLILSLTNTTYYLTRNLRTSIKDRKGEKFLCNEDIVISCKRLSDSMISTVGVIFRLLQAASTAAHVSLVRHLVRK